MSYRTENERAIHAYLLEHYRGPVVPFTWYAVVDALAEVSEDWAFYQETLRMFDEHDFDVTRNILTSLKEDVGAMVVLVTSEDPDDPDNETLCPFVYVGSGIFFTADSSGEYWSVDRETLLDIVANTDSELRRGYWYA